MALWNRGWRTKEGLVTRQASPWNYTSWSAPVSDLEWGKTAAFWPGFDFMRNSKRWRWRAFVCPALERTSELLHLRKWGLGLTSPQPCPHTDATGRKPCSKVLRTPPSYPVYERSPSWAEDLIKHDNRLLITSLSVYSPELAEKYGIQWESTPFFITVSRDFGLTACPEQRLSGFSHFHRAW